MSQDPGRTFVAGSHRGVLATIKRDGRPQMSNMSYILDEDGRIKMSTRGPNVKVTNIRRDPRVTVAIQGETWGDYLIVDGTATIVDEDPIPTLKRIYEGIRGTAHPNWQEFEASQISEQRVVIDIDIQHMYPVGRLSR
ncbi:MAG: PPOX class F420-dependent oxidoreductase [Chloroflexota bacterium]